MQRDQAPDGYRNLPFAPAKRRLSTSNNHFLDPTDFRQEYEESPKRACTPDRFYGQPTGLGQQPPTTFCHQADDVRSGSQAGCSLTFGDFLDSQTYESQDLNPMAISGLMNPVTYDPDRMEEPYHHWPTPVPEFSAVDNLGLPSQYELGLGNADMLEAADLEELPLCDEDVSDFKPQFPLESQYFQPRNDTLGEPFPQTIITADLDIPLPDASNHAEKHADPAALANEAANEADKTVPPSPSPSDPGYDTCFGMISIEGVHVSGNRESKKKQITQPKEVNFSPSHGTVMLTNKTSKRYCGLMSRDAADTVLSLLFEYKLHITATLEPSGTISALIYGREAQGTRVGDFLSNHDCFLQHPDSYDESTTYKNPQWLLRPGSEFKAENISRISNVSVSTILNAHKKSKVVEIMDSAAGPANFNRIEISSLIVTKLKEHQKKALSMMVEKESGILRDPVFPSLWVEVDSTETFGPRYLNTILNTRIARRPNICLGGLLADDMGLGKTLTVLSLIASSLDKSRRFQTQHGHTTLVIAPLSTLTSWEDQINLHFKPDTVRVLVYHGTMRYRISSFDKYDIILTNYDTVRAEFKFSSEEMNTSPLALATWTRIVLDEAHYIRNRSSQIFTAVNNLKATYRWCVTGTPIQNSIEDLGSLVGFLRAQPYDDAKRFTDTFVRPIKSGNHSGWRRLQALIQGISLRRTKASLATEINLPPREEIWEQVQLDKQESNLYDLFLQHFTSPRFSEGSSKGSFHMITRLRQICDHGPDLLPERLAQWLQTASTLEATPPPYVGCCDACGDDLTDEARLETDTSLCLHEFCGRCFRLKDNEQSPSCPLCSEDDQMDPQGHTRVRLSTKPCVSPDYCASSKVKALLKNLSSAGSKPAGSNEHESKSIVFSIWTKMLDLIGRALEQQSITFERLDGSQSLHQRQRAIANFRNNPRCGVLLASIGSTGVGLDLTMASNVHIVEPGWNPMLERQALDRVHRLGQRNRVVCFRYVVTGDHSIEEYIKKRQEDKLDLISASLDVQGIEPRTLVGTIIEEFRSKVCS